MNPVRVMLLALVTALICATPCSLHAGGSFQSRTFLLKNKEYGDALIQGIREARTSITGSFFLFKMGSRGSQPRRIAEELVLAAQRGVAVTVILEKERDPRPKDRLSEENRRTADFLARQGVTVLFDSPSVVTHVKVAVIDGRYVYLGSHNLTQSALRHNNELSVRIDSPELAAEVTAYLERL
jgi:phosphatidylserine/phosphatidylglycerophosphate/cardiolipin synthase-like enzyme